MRCLYLALAFVSAGFENRNFMVGLLDLFWASLSPSDAWFRQPVGSHVNSDAVVRSASSLHDSIPRAISFSIRLMIQMRSASASARDTS